MADERVYGTKVVQYRKDKEKESRAKLDRQGDKGALVKKLLEEIEHLRDTSKGRIANEERMMQKADQRFYFRQEQLLKQMKAQQDVLK